MFNLQDLQAISKALVDLRFVQAAALTAIDVQHKQSRAEVDAYMKKLSNLNKLVNSEIDRINKL